MLEAWSPEAMLRVRGTFKRCGLRNHWREKREEGEGEEKKEKEEEEEEEKEMEEEEEKRASQI